MKLFSFALPPLSICVSKSFCRSYNTRLEIISTAILSLPLIQVGQLSVAGEIECALSTG